MNKFDRMVAKQKLIENLQNENKKLNQQVKTLQEELKEHQINNMVEIETHEVAVVNISLELQNWIEDNLYPSETSGAVLGFKDEYDINNETFKSLEDKKLKQEVENLREALANVDKNYFYIRHGY
jgi:hypothetical protein